MRYWRDNSAKENGHARISKRDEHRIRLETPLLGEVVSCKLLKLSLKVNPCKCLIQTLVVMHVTMMWQTEVCASYARCYETCLGFDELHSPSKHGGGHSSAFVENIAIVMMSHTRRDFHT